MRELSLGGKPIQLMNEGDEANTMRYAEEAQDTISQSSVSFRPIDASVAKDTMTVPVVIGAGLLLFSQIST